MSIWMYHCPFVPTDPNLNVNTLMSLLSTLSVTILEYCLQIPDKKRKEIKRQCRTEGDRREKLVRWYLDFSPFADFNDLAGELYFYEKTSILEQLKGYVQREPGMSCNACIAGVVGQC